MYIRVLDLKLKTNIDMKTILCCLIALLTLSTYAQSTPKRDTLVIHTSAQCGDCKTRIEEALNASKGVVFSELDMESKDVTIVYKHSKTNRDALSIALTEAGYDADLRKANPKAVLELPKCCQPKGH
jgi:copper chaperone CopZ